MAISGAFEVRKSSAELTEDDLNSHSVKLESNKEAMLANAVSGSQILFLNKKKVSIQIAENWQIDKI